MKKRITLALILALCLGLAVSALAADSDFVIQDGTLVKYTGPGGDVVIPDGVTRIAYGAFSYCDDLVNVAIPDSVTDIGSCAFIGCSNLAKIYIPDSVTRIGRDAFTQCVSLTSVIIPSSVTTLEGSVFVNCTGLTNVTILSELTTIESYMFYGCSNLVTLTFPSSVTNTGYQAFFGTDLTDVYCIGSEEESSPIFGTSDMIHYIPFAYIAYPSTQLVDVDGTPVEFQCYALKDEKGNDTNYIKLRDVAYVLSGTAVQFDVGWDGAVNLQTGKGYTPNGSEMRTPFSGQRAYEPATARTRVNGAAAALGAIVLKDDDGGAYTYYKLRDLGAALGFTVDWSADRGIYIETR